MSKDQKKRRMNQLLKRNHIGMKWQRHFNSQQEWSEAVNNFTNKKG